VSPSFGETKETWEDQEHLQDEEERALMGLSLTVRDDDDDDDDDHDDVSGSNQI
jgi:hypothetical protein